MIKYIISWIAITCLMFACSPKVFDLSQYDQQLLDTVVVSAPRNINTESKNPYRSTSERTIDLLHTKLDLNFDWENEAVLGVAALTFSPLFYPTSAI